MFTLSENLKAICKLVKDDRDNAKFFNNDDVYKGVEYKGYKPLKLEQLKNLAHNFNKVVSNLESYIENEDDKSYTLISLMNIVGWDVSKPYRCCDHKFGEVNNVTWHDEVENDKLVEKSFIIEETPSDIINTLDLTYFYLHVSPIYRYALLTEINSFYFETVNQTINKIEIKFLSNGISDESTVDKIMIKIKVLK